MVMEEAPMANIADDACLSCGACCAAFRVDFHRADLAAGAPGKPDGAGVPRELAVPLTARLYRMCGTGAAPPRCIALEGEVGRGGRAARFMIGVPAPAATLRPMPRSASATKPAIARAGGMG